MRIVGLSLLILTAACATLAQPSGPRAVAYSLPRTLRVQVRQAGTPIVLAVPLEDYVAATILSEVDPPEADRKVLERMFEVQAVLTRTYAVGHRARHAGQGFDVCSTTHCQLYEPDRLRTSKWSTLAREAAARTAGQILWFDHAPARAVYHADCGGHTSASRDVWEGDALVYLPSASDEGPAKHAHASWSFDVGRDALRDALNADPRTRVGTQLQTVQIDEEDRAGRAERVTLVGTRTVAVRGEVLREVVTRAFGLKSLRSTLFHVARNGNLFTFSGRGFGHGVGLCQAGAFARLQAGQNPSAVLRHYFPGTMLTRAAS
jgi:stage II sporulation protein D